jgi:hypothetical protein
VSDNQELFQLDGGELVGTGLTMPTAADQLLMAAVAEYPANFYLEDPEIKRRLRRNSVDVYLEKRKKRAYRVRNQGRLGKCNGSSNTSGFEQLREEQGMKNIPLSDCSVYSRINGGSDRGSALITSYEELQKLGPSPMQFMVNGVMKTLPNDFYNRRQVDSAIVRQMDIEAKRFTGFEFYKAPMDSFANYCRAVASALARDQPVVFAWHVANGSASMKLRNGFAVVGRGAGNHSNLMHSAKWIGGKNLIHPDDMNSWGPTVNAMYGSVGGSGWGEGGFGLFTMEDMWACARNHCTYILTSVHPDPMDPAFQ